MQLFLWIYCDKGFRKYSSRFQVWSTEIRCQGMIFYVNLDCSFIGARGSPCRQATLALKSNEVHQLPPSPWQDDNSFKESVGQQCHQYQQKQTTTSLLIHKQDHDMALKARSWLRTGIKMWRGVKTATVIPSFSDNMISNSNTDINTINDFDFWCFNATRQYFSYIMATSFSSGRSWREPPTMGKQLVNFITCGCESSAPFLVHLCELLLSLSVCRSSVNFKKNLLLWNHWANLNQTWSESSLGGYLSNLCPMILPTNHHGRHVYK